MELNYFEKIKGKPEMPVDDIVDVQFWADLIKTGGKYKEIMLKARDIVSVEGKTSERYKSIKKQSIPCICWNFLFDGYKLNNCISKPTGFLYIDLDHPGFDINQIDKSKIFCFFKSLSNTGYGIVVRVNGLNLNNIKEATFWIGQQIGVNHEFIDKKAIKATQFNALTYYPELIINWSAPVFDLNELSKSKSQVDNGEKRCNSLTNTLSTPNRISQRIAPFSIRYKDAGDYVGPDQEYAVFATKIDTTELFFPKPHSIPQGRRNYVINGLYASMMAINKGIPEVNAKRWLESINQTFCVEPLKQQEIDRIHSNIWENLDLNKIKKRKKRRIIFNTSSKLSKSEKQSIVCKEIGKLKSDATRKKIYTFIEQYNGKEKITAKFVASEIGISIRTVKTYWPEFKEYVKQLNLK